MYLDRNRIYLLKHVVLPVMVGTLIYTTMRSKTLLVFSWYDTVGVSGQIDVLRESLSLVTTHLPSLIKYSLPDGLWVYSLTAAMVWVWKDEATLSFAKCFWLQLALLCGNGGEILQLFHLIPGTFDINDLLVSTIAFIAALRFTGRPFNNRFPTTATA